LRCRPFSSLAFTFIYGSAGLLNGTLMSLFAFELPPVDFLYSIQGSYWRK
jgi:2-aminoethylphosphonate transport system permease protein